MKMQAIMLPNIPREPSRILKSNKNCSEKSVDGKISCAAAHAIAVERRVAPEKVGIAIDLLEARIQKCQLGLFGYQPEKRIVTPVREPSPDVETAIKAQLVNGRIHMQKMLGNRGTAAKKEDGRFQCLREHGHQGQQVSVGRLLNFFHLSVKKILYRLRH
jgi:hypothetical protein